MDRCTAQKHGAPTGKEFESIFGKDCAEVFAIQFVAVQPEEVPQDCLVIVLVVQCFSKEYLLFALSKGLFGLSVIIHTYIYKNRALF